MPILVFSMYADPVIASRALAGATGYLVRNTSAADLLEAFDKVWPDLHQPRPCA